MLRMSRRRKQIRRYSTDGSEDGENFFILKPDVCFFNAGQIKLRFFLFFLAVARTVAYMTAISMQHDALRSLISLSSKITGAVGSVNHPSPRSVLRTLLFVSPPPHWTLVQSI